jgi:hypothetical protein
MTVNRKRYEKPSRTKRIAKLPQELMIGDVPTVDDGAIEPTALALL